MRRRLVELLVVVALLAGGAVYWLSNMGQAWGVIGVIIIIFLAAWCVMAISLFLAIGEGVAIRRFRPWAFAAGMRVLRETQMLPSPTGAIGSKFETSNGEFKVVASHICFFRWKMGWSRLFEVHTSFPIKGSLRWVGSQATIVGRIPLFTTLFFAAWLVGWTVSGALMVFLPGGLVIGLAFLLFGWAMMAGMCLFSIPLEVRRARQIVNEYEALSASMAFNEPEPGKDQRNRP